MALDPRNCACGCGEEFTPKKPWQKFVNTAHQQEYWFQVREQAKVLVVDKKKTNAG